MTKDLKLDDKLGSKLVESKESLTVEQTGIVSVVHLAALLDSL